ncbi:L,D-transpeptidase family protein [Brevibacillus massiliensis]|uniref:L,D-transpeptidase family protein n=1 Tax=Brevibacillus massiliensis TaxID=1118054 RepID=UPI0002D74CEB|nr:L,D-transpeptidase family protein [Brevibacillus massiliensis]
MNKAQFLQEKATFLLTYPDHDDLVFHLSFVKQHPEETVGWLFLGREWEKRGKEKEALEAYRKALHTKPGEFSEEAREAYQNLLRKQKKRLIPGLFRSISGLLAVVATILCFPVSVGEHVQQLPQNAKTAEMRPPATEKPSQSKHVEVIAVPDQMPDTQVKEQVLQYLRSRRPALHKPYSVILVPETEGVPLYTPLLFYQPTRIKGIMEYNPDNHSILGQKWYPRNCPTCDKEPLIQTAKKALATEQRTLEQVLTLRNALYRTYQRKGRLPLQLQDLAAGYPDNILSAIPQPSIVEENGSSPAWTYRPEAFRPEQAWASMSEVLPLPAYPEPAVPLQPLQIYIHQGSYSLSLVSGSHPVRRFAIGIGKENATPEGYFTILQKINRPRGHDHIYGSRGFIFDNEGYAIHGTNNPKSIGQSVSLGCIRLSNEDVEELYSFVSLGTEVIISDKSVPIRSWSNPGRFLLPAGPKEETPEVMYHWLH